MAKEGLILVCCLFTWLHCCYGDTATFMMELSDLTEKEQITENHPFQGIGQWQTLEGNHKNYFIFNFHGHCEMVHARHTIRVPDVTSFVSTYVAILLLDAHRFGNAPMSSQTQMNRIVDMMAQFHDNNKGENSIVAFYPQAYDESNDLWYINPENIANAYSKMDQLLPISLPTVLLGPAPLPEGFKEFFSPSGFSYRSPVPPDFDSSTAHLGFGSMLSDARDLYPESWEKWTDDNQNIQSVFDAMKKYAYRPFSDDQNENSIDPRSYYVMRGFIDKAKEEGRDVALVTTWVQNLEELRTQYDKRIVIPFGLNTVDIGVVANVMSGMYLAFSSGVADLDVLSNDPDLQLVIDSSASLLVYELQRNLTDRPDLALVYYQSIQQFYWMVSRSLMYMEKDKLKGPLVAPVFEKYYDELKEVMSTKITADIISRRQVDPYGGIFYDDFIGNDDLSECNRPINHAEDRIYTTSMAANALLYTWTVYDEDQDNLTWKESVPDSVKETVKGCASWLERETLSGKYLLSGSFFGLDYKNRESIIYFYPANRFEFINGTQIDDITRLPGEYTVYGMEGYVEPEEYERLLKMDKFGVPTPLTFQGFNEGQGYTALWTSDAWTYASVLLTVSMNDALEE